MAKRCLHAKDYKERENNYWLCELDNQACAVSRRCTLDGKILHVNVQGCKNYTVKAGAKSNG